MERQEAVDFILNEAKRLNEEEHIGDLCKAGRYEELSRVECMTSNAILVYLNGDKQICLEENEIPEGSYLAIAIWINTICFSGIIADEKKFADKLAAEAGKLGKAIAWKMKEEEELAYIPWDDFFDDSDADKYKAEEN